MDASFYRMTAAQLAAGLKKKAFSAQELCRAAIERIGSCVHHRTSFRLIKIR